MGCCGPIAHIQEKKSIPLIGHINMKKMYRQLPKFQIPFPLPQNQYNFGERLFDELTSRAHTANTEEYFSLPSDAQIYKLTNQHHIYNRIS
jgi:hypothetical protein